MISNQDCLLIQVIRSVDSANIYMSNDSAGMMHSEEIDAPITLVASDAAETDRLGLSVSIYGAVLAAGAPNDRVSYKWGDVSESCNTVCSEIVALEGYFACDSSIAITSAELLGVYAAAIGVTCTSFVTNDCSNLGWDGTVPFYDTNSAGHCFYCEDSAKTSCGALHMFRRRLCSCVHVTGVTITAHIPDFGKPGSLCHRQLCCVFIPSVR